MKRSIRAWVMDCACRRTFAWAGPGWNSSPSEPRLRERGKGSGPQGRDGGAGGLLDQREQSAVRRVVPRQLQRCAWDVNYFWCDVVQQRGWSSTVVGVIASH